MTKLIGNQELVNRFIEETTSEERAALLPLVVAYVNEVANGIKEDWDQYKTEVADYLTAAQIVLMAQTSHDNGNASDEDRNNLINQAGQAANNAATAIRIDIQNLVVGTRNEATFKDVINEVLNGGTYYRPADLDPATSGEIEDKASIILTTVTNIGMVISILILAILGIKYMIGSIDEKAEYKKDMMPYLVGAWLAFGATGIVKLLMAVGVKLNSF